MKFVSILAPASVLLFSSFTWAASAVVDVNLSPAGSFKAKTAEVVGFAIQKAGEVTAQNIVVKLKGLKTGVDLRDKHTLKHLETEKFPEAVLLSAKGKDGKGTGKIRIRGIEKDISGTYKISGTELQADFKLKLPDFNINNIKYMGVGVDEEVVLHIAVPVKAGK
jgi:polyisoprenoid-binding protein YceI